MIRSILSHCWEHDVNPSVVDGNIKADFKKGNFPDELRFLIKQNKPALIERLKQNDLLEENGWIIYLFGEVYEYHLSLRSYLYIDREEDGTHTLWRNTLKGVGQDQSKVLLSQATFNDVYVKATDYISWWTGQQKKVSI